MYVFVVGSWLLLISTLTVNKVAPEFLNADVLINSIMSLQNLTLYYWGQNRLLNILPLAVALIRDPATNLATVLVISSLSFYFLLFVISRFAALAINASNIDALSLKIFVLISTAFVCIFKPYSISEIAISHIEYSFAALLLGVAFYMVFLKKENAQVALSLAVAAIFLAIGLNQSTVLPAVFVSAATMFYKRRFGKAELIMCVSSLFAFVVWHFVSKQYGNLPYNKFEPSILTSGLVRVVSGLAGTLNITIFMIFTGILVLVKIFLFFCNNKGETASDLVKYVCFCVVLFSMGWLLLFAGNQWVEMNNFAWRYFIFVIFGAIYLTAISIADILNTISREASGFVTMSVALLAFAVTFSAPITFNEYKVFQRVNTLTASGCNLYSGDYWVVWPSVLRDMMQGYKSYGLTNRGEANRDAARKYVLDKIKNDGHVSVFCLNEKYENCINHINSIVGRFYSAEPTIIHENVFQIFLSDYKELSFQRESFLVLPSQVGLIKDGLRKSDGRAGFMVFGPYYSLKAGSYRLSVYGSSIVLNDVYVDVVSANGNNIHAKYNLQQYADDVLMSNAIVHLPSDVLDIEVRVWVDQNSELQLMGYKLEPFLDAFDE